MKITILSLSSAMFFAVTFILNRSMGLEGGSWYWTSSLRFFFMLPILFLIVGIRKNIRPVFTNIKKKPYKWICWSTIGFGFFYAPLTFATVYGPGWLVAATFQITIIAGSLLVPWINSEENHTIPFKSIFISFIILTGVYFIQFEYASTVHLKVVLLCVISIVISAFSYPLGNRKMIQLVNGELDTFQRILGMTLASLPFWFLLAFLGGIESGLPDLNQIIKTFIVAMSSGIIATALFFYATEIVKDDMHKLAAVEATQATEVVFALLGEWWLLNTSIPSFISFIGILFVMIGMILHSFTAIFKKVR